MKEEIEKIIEKHYDPDSETLESGKIAEEISEHILEFLEWIRTTCEVEDSNMWYYPYKDLIFSTSEELFDYWLKNIKTSK